MRIPLQRPALAFLVLFLAGRARADEVLLNGGSRLPGVVLAQDATGVHLLPSGGEEIVLAAADVKSVQRDAQAPKDEQVLRFASGEAGGAQGLQVAVVHLRHPTTGRRVDLVGAVHIADVAFYREVQRLLEADDVVLYEMVKPKDAAPSDKPPEPAEGDLNLRDLQRRMGEWFGLSFQLDEIAYDRPHFVHADLTLEEFSAQTSGQDVKAQVKAMLPMLKLIDGFLKPRPGTKAGAAQLGLKAMVGRMLGNMGAKVGALLGEDTSELLIGKRNAVAVQRLTEVGPEAKSVAIFYGAAHLPDLEQRLAKLGYVRVASRWITAWDTRAPVEPPPAPPETSPAEAPKEAPAPK